MSDNWHGTIYTHQRVAADGTAYTYTDFVRWYGAHGTRMWEGAAATEHSHNSTPESSDVLPEQRIAADGTAYTYTDFVNWYGMHADQLWERAVATEHKESSSHAATATEHNESSSHGQGVASASLAGPTSAAEAAQAIAILADNNEAAKAAAAISKVAAEPLTSEERAAALVYAAKAAAAQEKSASAQLAEEMVIDLTGESETPPPSQPSAEHAPRCMMTGREATTLRLPENAAKRQRPSKPSESAPRPPQAATMRR